MADAGARQRQRPGVAAVVGERVFDGVGNDGGRRNDAALPHALDAELVHDGGVIEGHHVECRNLVGSRHAVVHEAPGEELTLGIEDEGFTQRCPDALNDAAVELALDDHGIDRAPAIVDGGVPQQGRHAGLDIHLQHASVGAERPRHRAGVEEGAGVETGASRGGEGRTPHGCACQLTERHAAFGKPGDVCASVHEHHVVGRAFERLGGDASRAIGDVAAGPRDGGTGDGGDAARDRAHSETDHAGVAADHDDALRWHAELGRADLGQRGLVRLPLGRHADEELDRPVRVDPDVGALERPDPGAFDIGRDPQPDWPVATPTLLLSLAPVAVVESVQHTVEGRGIVRGVVDDRDAIAIGQARPVRHLLGPHEVPATQGGRVHPDRARRAVEQAVHDERCLRSARAAIRGGAWLVRHDVDGARPIVPYPVGPRQMVHGVDGDDVAQHRIGAVVPRETRFERHDFAVVTDAEPGDVPLIAVGRAGHEVFGPRFHPLHGMPDPERDRRDQHVLRVDVALAAEAAADIGGDHSDGLFAHSQGRGERRPNGVWDLARRPDREASIRGPGNRENTTGLDRQRRDSRKVELDLDDLLSLAEPMLDVADVPPSQPRDVVRPFVEHAWRPWRLRRVDGGSDGERLVVHDERGSAIGRARGIVRDDDHDRLAHGAHDAAGERGVTISADGRRGHQGRHGRARTFGQVRPGEHRGDSRRHAGSRDVDPRDPRMGMRAPNDRGVKDPGQAEVVEIATPSRDETLILAALHRGADRRGHGGCGSMWPAVYPSAARRSRHGESMNYRPVVGWGRLPETWSYVEATSVAVDGKDNVIVFNRGQHPVIIFDREGRFLRSWGEGLIRRAHGITVGPDGSYWLTDDLHHTIRQFTPEGKLLLTIGDPDTPSTLHTGKPFNRPTHVAFGPKGGDIYISDGYGNSRVHKYDPAGRHLLSWGEPGTDPGCFNLPHNIATDTDGLVYVADRENHRMQIFDGHGHYLTQLNNLHRPCGLCCDRRNGGLLFVGELPSQLAVNKDVANLGARVSVVSLKGDVVCRVGGRFHGEKPGEFMAPHGCAVDSRGDLYVAEVSWTAFGSLENPPREIRSLQKLERV